MLVLEIISTNAAVGLGGPVRSRRQAFSRDGARQRSGRKIRPAVGRLRGGYRRHARRRGLLRAADIHVHYSYRRIRVYHPARLQRHALIVRCAVRPAACRRIAELDWSVATAAGITAASVSGCRGCRGRARRQAQAYAKTRRRFHRIPPHSGTWSQYSSPHSQAPAWERDLRRSGFASTHRRKLELPAPGSRAGALGTSATRLRFAGDARRAARDVKSPAHEPSSSARRPKSPAYGPPGLTRDTLSLAGDRETPHARRSEPRAWPFEHHAPTKMPGASCSGARPRRSKEA